MTKPQRLVLLISILASFVAFLDGSVINVALPAITNELGGGLVVQQWVVDAYLITLGSLMLVAGSLSDLFGRRKVLAAGLLGFGAASVLCAIAPTDAFLIIARALQGIAGALLVPSSLAIIIAAFSGSAQSKAIGTWTAWTGMAFVIGPLLGGMLVDILSWRLIFAINILPIVVTLWLMKNLSLEEPHNDDAKVDIVGSAFGAIGLGGSVYALIQQSHYGWGSAVVYVPLLIGIFSLMAFVAYEQRTAYPMLPLNLFKNRNFAVGNVATTFIYAGLSLATFIITIFLQQEGGYSATAAGLALLPVTLIMFVLSPRFGAWAGMHGPRLFMGVGPIVAALGFVYMLVVDDSSIVYWTELFPGIALFGVGLSITVAPLTSAVLGAIPARNAGIASATNNAIARIAGLIAIAGVGLITGPHINLHGFERGLIGMAVLLILGGIASLVGIQDIKTEGDKELLSTS